MKSVEEAGLPVLYLETDYGSGDTGQIKTRGEALLEMVRNGTR